MSKSSTAFRDNKMTTNRFFSILEAGPFTFLFLHQETSLSWSWSKTKRKKSAFVCEMRFWAWRTKVYSSFYPYFSSLFFLFFLSWKMMMDLLELGCVFITWSISSNLARIHRTIYWFNCFWLLKSEFSLDELFDKLNTWLDQTVDRHHSTFFSAFRC